MNRLERKLKKHIKLANKKLKENNRKVVVCKNCGQLFDREKEKGVVEFDMKTQDITFLCEKCNEKFTKEIEERDRIFKENCPKHYDCRLWCEPCKDKENCSYFKSLKENSND